MYAVRVRPLLQLSTRWQGWRRAHGLHRAALTTALVVAGCGRVGFDARGVGDGGGDAGDGGPGGIAISLVMPAGGQFRELAISPVDDTVYALSYFGGVFRSTNGGDSWVRCGAVPANALEVASDGQVFASGPGVYRSTDRCTTWITTDAPTSSLGIGVIGTTTYMLGDTALWRYDGDAAWTRISTPVEGGYFVAFSGNSTTGTRIVGTSANGIATSGDGMNWSAPATNLSTQRIVDVAVTPTRTYVLAGAEGGAVGGVACSDGVGASWQECHAAGGTALAVDPLDPDHVVYAVYDELGETDDAFANLTLGLRKAGGMDDAIVRDLQYSNSGVLWAATHRGVFVSTTRPPT